MNAADNNDVLDEEAEKAAFKEAVMAWRNSKPTLSDSNDDSMWHNPFSVNESKPIVTIIREYESQELKVKLTSSSSTSTRVTDNISMKEAFSDDIDSDDIHRSIASCNDSLIYKSADHDNDNVDDTLDEKAEHEVQD